jgi:ankyrin repeat protein
MKKITIKELEELRKKKLEERKYDEYTIKKFRSKIKKVSDARAKELGHILLAKINNNGRELNKNTSTVKNLILKGASLEVINERRGEKGIHLVSRKGYNNLFYYFVLGNADINAQTASTLETPVMLSTENEHNIILSDLILLGADLDIQNYEGDTALHKAMRDDPYNDANVEAAKMLIEANAILTIRNDRDMTAVDIARDTYYTSNANIILSGLETKKENENNKSLVLTREAIKETVEKVNYIKNR